jgi:hypothetical protein
MPAVDAADAPAAEPMALEPAESAAQTAADEAPKEEQAKSKSGTPDKKGEEIHSKSAAKTRGAKRSIDEAAPATKKMKA